MDTPQKGRCGGLHNSATGKTEDVPILIPEINHDHCDIIPAQPKALRVEQRTHCGQAELQHPELHDPHSRAPSKGLPGLQG